jgi:hypothetical protein
MIKILWGNFLINILVFTLFSFSDTNTIIWHGVMVVVATLIAVCGEIVDAIKGDK